MLQPSNLPTILRLQERLSRSPGIVHWAEREVVVEAVVMDGLLVVVHVVVGELVRVVDVNLMVVAVVVVPLLASALQSSQLRLLLLSR